MLEESTMSKRVVANGFRSGVPVILFLVIAALATTWWSTASSSAMFVQTFDSPLSTPPPLPTRLVPTPIAPEPTPEPSKHARIALQHLAQREGVPVEELLVVHEHPRGYPLTQRDFIALTIFDWPRQREFDVLVDVNTETVVDDVDSIEHAELEARSLKYGKLHPRLYERMQTAKPNDVLPVSIWIEGERGRNREVLYEILADRHSQVRTALQRHASPFDVGDNLLSQELHREYEQLLREDMVKRVQPAATQLAAQGFEVDKHDLLPALTANLPVRTIEQFVKRPDVKAMYLNDGEPAPALDSAVPTNRVSPVWEDGVNGGQNGKNNGRIRIAILEAENVDWDNSYLHHAPLQLVGIDGEGDHATRVASAAASFHDTLRGMAPEAEIVSAGFNRTIPGFHNSLEWALDPPNLNGGNADLVNVSYAWYENSSELQWIDRSYDFTARERNATIIVAAGNRPLEYLPSPAKGWNVITVGGSHEFDTTDWSDDEMYTSSSFIDPDSPYHDRNKPEVIAPAQGIEAIGINNQPAESDGTSHAAPQVAGLTALLMHRDPAVREYPTAIKAILMASAVHNIEGDSTLSDRDGAGAIDARLADEIVQTYAGHGETCSHPCWWGLQTTSSFPASGGYVYEHFYATKGERIRVAIAWWSEADSPNPYLPPPWTPPLADDILATNFNLYVWEGSTLVGYSAWWDNNYEIIEFTARLKPGNTRSVFTNGPRPPKTIIRSASPGQNSRPSCRTCVPMMMAGSPSPMSATTALSQERWRWPPLQQTAAPQLSMPITSTRVPERRPGRSNSAASVR